MDQLDEITDYELNLLKEEIGKYKIRLFQIEIVLNIDAEYGVEETMQALRAIPGVTVVSVIGSHYNKDRSTYSSRCRFKFHPKKESTGPTNYVKRVLLPRIRSNDVPGTKINRIAGKPERIS